MAGELGRRVPGDFAHITKYPWNAVGPLTVDTVERTLKLPRWHKSHNQGREGSCVGHGAVMERAIVNSAQAGKTVRYDPISLWNAAKEIDEWADTNPGDSNGTSVRAAYDVLRDRGACRIRSAKYNEATGQVQVSGRQDPDPASGVAANRWATSVDEMRAAIQAGNPVTIGVNWYSNFDAPVNEARGVWWIGRSDLGQVRGGHCICIYGASDRKQAFKAVNSWGDSYPLVWLPYNVMQRLLNEDGEATLTTDK